MITKSASALRVVIDKVRRPMNHFRESISRLFPPHASTEDILENCEAVRIAGVPPCLRCLSGAHTWFHRISVATWRASLQVSHPPLRLHHLLFAEEPPLARASGYRHLRQPAAPRRFCPALPARDCRRSEPERQGRSSWLEAQHPQRFFLRRPRPPRAERRCPDRALPEAKSRPRRPRPDRKDCPRSGSCPALRATAAPAGASW